MLSILLKVTQVVIARSSVKPISLIPKVTFNNCKAVASALYEDFINTQKSALVNTNCLIDL